MSIKLFKIQMHHSEPYLNSCWAWFFHKCFCIHTGFGKHAQDKAQVFRRKFCQAFASTLRGEQKILNSRFSYLDPISSRTRATEWAAFMGQQKWIWNLCDMETQMQPLLSTRLFLLESAPGCTWALSEHSVFPGQWWLPISDQSLHRVFDCQWQWPKVQVSSHRQQAVMVKGLNQTFLCPGLQGSGKNWSFLLSGIVILKIQSLIEIAI